MSPRLQPTHLRLGGRDGGMTACNLRGIQHRPLKYTDDPLRVTCLRCRRWPGYDAARANALRRVTP